MIFKAVSQSFVFRDFCRRLPLSSYQSMMYGHFSFDLGGHSVPDVPYCEQCCRCLRFGVSMAEEYHNAETLWRQPPKLSISPLIVKDLNGEPGGTRTRDP